MLYVPGQTRERQIPWRRSFWFALGILLKCLESILVSGTANHANFELIIAYMSVFDRERYKTSSYNLLVLDAPVTNITEVGRNGRLYVLCLRLFGT